MAGFAYCNGCGQRLEVPAGYAKAKFRCPECGVFTELPKEIREQGQSAKDAPEPPKPAAPATRRPEESTSRRPPQPTSRPPASIAAPVPAPTPVPPPPPESELDGGYGFQEEPTPPKPALPAPPKEKTRVAKASAEEIPDREILIHGTEEEDFNPYTVGGDAPTKRCPECEKKVGVRDKVCSHCGYDFDSGEKNTRTYQSLSYEWENGWTLQRRMLVFICMQVGNFLLLAMLTIAGVRGSTPVVMVLFMVFLQAFLCGTYEKLTLSRTQKGKVTMRMMWRVAFIPRPFQVVKWKEYESLIIVQSNETTVIDWVTAIILLTYALLPGVLYWWLVIRPDKFAVTLCRDHGFPEIAVFRTLSEARAKEVLQTVCDTTTLPVHK